MQVVGRAIKTKRPDHSERLQNRSIRDQIHCSNVNEVCPLVLFELEPMAKGMPELKGNVRLQAWSQQNSFSRLGRSRLESLVAWYVTQLVDRVAPTDQELAILGQASQHPAEGILQSQARSFSACLPHAVEREVALQHNALAFSQRNVQKS